MSINSTRLYRLPNPIEPGEQAPYSFDLAPILAANGETPIRLGLSIKPSGSGELQAESVYLQSDNKIIYTLSGGVAGRQYLIQIVVTYASGNDDVILISASTDLALGTWPPSAPPSADFGSAVVWAGGAVAATPAFVPVQDGITAAGTTQADATLLAAQTNIVTTVPPGTGVRLRALVQGTVRVLNRGANDLLVYPPSAQSIDGQAANAPVTVASGAAAAFSIAAGGTEWRVTYDVLHDLATDTIRPGAVSTGALTVASGTVGQGVVVSTGTATTVSLAGVDAGNDAGTLRLYRSGSMQLNLTADAAAGGSNFVPTNLYIGAPAAAVPGAWSTIRGTDGTGADSAGTTFQIIGGRGTGKGVGGDIVFSTAAAGSASGTGNNAAAERFRVSYTGAKVTGGLTVTGLVNAAFLLGGAGGAIGAGTFGHGLYLSGTALSSRAADGYIFAADYNLPANGNDAVTQLQAAINDAQAQGKALVLPAGGDFKLSASLVAYLGKANSGDYRHDLRIFGNNCRLRPTGAFPALTLQPLCPNASVSNGWANYTLELHDIAFDGYYATANGLAASALLIGKDGYTLLPTQNSLISNISFASFLTSSQNSVIKIVANVQRIVWERVSMQAGTTFELAATAGGHFIGDLIFHGCLFGVGAIATPPIWVHASGGTGSTNSTTAEIRGLKFLNCGFYGSGSLFDVGAYSQVGDIWFMGCAWDGPNAPAGEYALKFNANGSVSELFQIHLVEPYIVNYTACALEVTVSNGGTTSMFDVKGGGLQLITPATGTANLNAVIALIGTTGFTIDGTAFDSCTGDSTTTALVSLDGCTNTQVKNILGTCSTQTGGHIKYGVTTLNACNRYQITGCLFDAASGITAGNEVHDTAAGTPIKVVTNNVAG